MKWIFIIVNKLLDGDYEPKRAEL